MALIWHDDGNEAPAITWRVYLRVLAEVMLIGGGGWLLLVGALLLGG